MEGNTLETQYDYYLNLAHLYDTIDLEVPWDWRKQHVQNYMPSSNAQRIGAIAESKFQTECLERDFEPHMPATPMPWDFIVTCPAGMLKVQVKSSSVRDGQCYSVVTSSGCKGKLKMSNEVDIVACYIPPENMWWMIPRYDLGGKTIKLNPEPTSKSRYKKYQENWSIFYE
jgi:hypothetical protein